MTRIGVDSVGDVVGKAASWGCCKRGWRVKDQTGQLSHSQHVTVVNRGDAVGQKDGSLCGQSGDGGGQGVAIDIGRRCQTERNTGGILRDRNRVVGCDGWILQRINIDGHRVGSRLKKDPIADTEIKSRIACSVLVRIRHKNQATRCNVTRRNDNSCSNRITVEQQCPVGGNGVDPHGH